MNDISDKIKELFNKTIIPLTVITLIGSSATGFEGCSRYKDGAERAGYRHENITKYHANHSTSKKTRHRTTIKSSSTKPTEIIINNYIQEPRQNQNRPDSYNQGISYNNSWIPVEEYPRYCADPSFAEFVISNRGFGVYWNMNPGFRYGMPGGYGAWLNPEGMFYNTYRSNIDMLGFMSRYDPNMNPYLPRPGQINGESRYDWQMQEGQRFNQFMNETKESRIEQMQYNLRIQSRLDPGRVPSVNRGPRGRF